MDSPNTLPNTPSLSSGENNPNKGHGVLREFIQVALIALLIVLPIRIFVIQPFIVSGSSMDPTFGNGDYLIVDQLTYRFEEPNRGDVIIFRYPNNPSTFFIKRIIGLPGETLSIQGNQIHITNEEHPDSFMLLEHYIDVQTPGNITITLSEDEYFVLGDNRPESSDSRVWGPLDERLIVGRAFIRILPVTQAQILPGKASSQSSD